MHRWPLQNAALNDLVHILSSKAQKLQDINMKLALGADNRCDFIYIAIQTTSLMD